MLLKKAERSRKALYRSLPRQKYRHNWLSCIRRYEKIYTRYPKTDQAVWAIYQSARLYTGLYSFSGRPADLDRAILLYRRVADKYAKHRLADDAQYRLGEIFYKYKKDLPGACVEFIKVEMRFPAGDMRSKAVKMAERISSALGKKNKSMIKRPDPEPRSELIAVKDIRYWSAPNYTRVVVDLEDPVKYEHHLLKGGQGPNKPRRLYLDLKNARISAQIDRTIPIKGELLQRARAGQHTKDTVRVVLDMESINGYRVFHLHEPFRIVVDVRRKKTSPAAQPLLNVHKIVIDPAHGGKDSGCRLSGIKEKNITLSISKLLAEKIAVKIGCEAVLTRDKDVFLPLERRTAIANIEKADLFISLHVNADNDKTMRGLETYFLNVTTDYRSMILATRENRASQKNMSDLQSILNDLLLNSNVHESRRFAYELQKGVLSRITKKYKGIKDLGVKQAPLYVLIGADMPAILVQTGFISNPVEKRRLLDKKYQECLAEGICEGIIAYLKTRGRV